MMTLFYEEWDSVSVVVIVVPPSIAMIFGATDQYMADMAWNNEWVFVWLWGFWHVSARKPNPWVTHRILAQTPAV